MKEHRVNPTGEGDLDSDCSGSQRGEKQELARAEMTIGLDGSSDRSDDDYGGD